MDLKQQFQQDMRDAMRGHDQARVNVIRMFLAAFEHAQETMGKQAFDAFDQEAANIQPDRHQTLSKETIKDVIRRYLQWINHSWVNTSARSTSSGSIRYWLACSSCSG